MKKALSHFVLLILFLSGGQLMGQEKRVITIQQAGSFGKDEANFPGANILLKKDNIRVKLFHQGALIESDKSFFYSKKNAFKAQGEVIFTQGDSIRMTSAFMEYDGETGKAKAWGNVFLEQPDMTLETDTLFLDRFDDLAYYETPGTIVDSASVLKSNRGRYYMKEKKYRFLSNVRIKNPEYQVTSSQLDYYTESNKAFLYGPTKIIGKIMISTVKKGSMTPKTKGDILTAMRRFYTTIKSLTVTVSTLKTVETTQQLPIKLKLPTPSINPSFEGIMLKYLKRKTRLLLREEQ